MNPLLIVAIQLLQALGLLALLQGFFVAVLALAILFYALSFFVKPRG